MEGSLLLQNHQQHVRIEGSDGTLFVVFRPLIQKRLSKAFQDNKSPKIIELPRQQLFCFLQFMLTGKTNFESLSFTQQLSLLMFSRTEFPELQWVHLLFFVFFFDGEGFD